MKSLILSGLFYSVLASASLCAAEPPITIALAGDSTVANYAKTTQQRGWGQFLQTHFDNSVVVVNLAKNGRSTKTFLAEGLWANLLAKKPDIVLIQFGHNDSHSADRPEHTDPEGNYKTILEQYIDDVRHLGATPVLVTPVMRRGSTDGLLPYSEAMKEVASDKKVALIDLHKLSGELYAKLGPAQSDALGMPGDKTHFNGEGAAQMAAIVSTELIKALPLLQTHSRVPAANEPEATALPYSLFPEDGVPGVNPDTTLRVRFDEPINVAKSGTIQVFDRSTDTLVESIDLSHPTAMQAIGGIPDFKYYPVTVSGKVVTVHLKTGSLGYNKSYYVKMSPGVFSFTSTPTAAIAEEVAWSFSTKVAPPPADQVRITVDADGKGDFSTVQGALDFIPDGNKSPRTVFIHKGVYTEIVAFANKDSVSIIGEDRKGTIIEYANNAKFNDGGGNPYANGGTPNSPVHKQAHIYHRGLFLAHRDNNLVLSNLTIHNTTAHGGSQAEAIIINGTLDAHAIIKDVDLYSFQDTLQINGQAFIENSYIEGDVDFLWGTGPSFFQDCTFKSVKSDAYYTQIRNPATNHGFVFNHCVFEGSEGVTNNFLSRIEPDRFPASEVVLLNCTLSTSVGDAAWFLQGPKGAVFQTNSIHFWEYADVDPSGKPLETPDRLPASKRLDAKQDADLITKYSTPSFVLGGWDPLPAAAAVGKN